jgi:hypothetical protein
VPGRSAATAPSASPKRGSRRSTSLRREPGSASTTGASPRPKAPRKARASSSVATGSATTGAHEVAGDALRLPQGRLEGEEREELVGDPRSFCARPARQAQIVGAT